MTGSAFALAAPAWIGARGDGRPPQDSTGALCAGDRLEPSPLAPLTWPGRLAAMALSLALHAALFAWLAGAPLPAGSGTAEPVEAIAVELVADTPAASLASPQMAGADAPAQAEAPLPDPASADAAPAPSPPEPPVPAKAGQAPPAAAASPPAEVRPKQAPPAAPEAIVETIAQAAGDSLPPGTDAAAISPPKPPAAPPAIRPLPRENHPAAPSPKARKAKRRAGGQALSRTAGGDKPARATSAGSGGGGKPARNGEDALARYLAAVRARITGERAHWRGLGRGRVEVRFLIAADGRLGGLRVTASTDDALSGEALNAVRHVSPVAPIPPEVGHKSLAMSVTIEFR